MPIEINGQRDWMTTQEAADHLKVTLSAIYKYKRDRRLKEHADWIKLHGRHYFRQRSLDAIKVGEKAENDAK